jgi:antitoxin (DNA-binding transcriptional repressor) of toxin-antitoxin stability system
VNDLPAKFQEIVSLAAAGTEVLVTDGNAPRAKLVPLSQGGARIPGLHPGAVQTSDDFDAPLPEDFW